MSLLDKLRQRNSPPPVVYHHLELDSIMDEVRGMSAAKMFRTQPHLRTVTTFLGRNIAHLGLHCYQRLSGTDRRRDTTSPLGQWLGGYQANPYMTIHQLVFATVVDKALYDRAYWWPHQREGGWDIYRLPPAWVEVQEKDALGVEWYRIKGKASIHHSELVVFNGYSPTQVVGESPAITALKEVLAEQVQAMRYRSQLWSRGGRVSAVLTRPMDAPRWSDAAREAFREDWYAQYTGRGPRAGGTPILEDGMQLSRVDFSATDQQYIEGLKLAYATVANAYHVNPTMVGLLENANYSNVREFRKMLYGDTLGPMIADIESVLNAWLRPIMGVGPDRYLEFNVAEKLQGDFEQQASFLQSAVGRPYMSANEARARMNLPQVEGADELVTPLNVLTGGLASPQDTDPTKALGSMPVKGHQALREQPEPSWHALRRREYRQALVDAIGRKAPMDVEDLEDRLFDLDLAYTTESARQILGDRAKEYDPRRTHNYLQKRAQSQVQRLIDYFTELDEDEAREQYLASGVEATAGAMATWSNGWGQTEAGRQTGAASKTWRVTSSNPRASHASMDGETVGMNEPFSNGLNWPGDGGDAEEVSNCQCEVVLEWP